MRIGELSRATGVAPSRIRFYERQGLLPAADRHSNGYRAYPGSAVQSLLFIRQGQELGFSLKEIKSVLPVAYGPRADCTQIVQSLREKLVQLDAHLARTLEARAEIQTMIGQLEDRLSHRD